MIATDETPSELQRGRGGFYRKSDDTPYVSDPSGDTVKSGPRKGLPKRTPYGSFSGAGKLIENTYNLQKWGERMTCRGLAIDPSLLADVCDQLATLDPDSDEFRTLADTIVVRAKDAAQTQLAADRGTHAHELSEDHDTDADWIARAEAGENLGIPIEAQQALVDAWHDCITRNGLEVLAVEAACVNDQLRLAGTLDRIVRTTVDLRFTLAGGEIVVVPAGTVLVLDVKSGKLKTERNGLPRYWQAYAVQIAGYAGSVIYDTEQETRADWEWPISQEHALIAHLDVLGAIDGKPSCNLIYVNIEAGREHGAATVVAAKEWAKRTDLFSVAQADTIAVPTPPDAPAPHGLAEGETPGATTAPPGVGTALIDLADNIVAAELLEGVFTREDAVEALTTALVGDHEPISVVARTVSPAEQLAALPTPTEGGPVDDDTFDVLQDRYKALPQAQIDEIATLIGDAQRHRVPFHAKGNRTVRRYEIIRGLVMLGEAGGIDLDVVRGLLELVIGDVAQYPAVTVGHALGSLSEDTAFEWADRCNQFVNNQFTAVANNDGQVSLHFAA